MKEEPLLLLSDLQKLINQVVLIDYTIIILGGNKMTTYRNLYHGMVRSMSEAIDLYDEGKDILAREVLKKALLDAEEQIIAQDIIPDEPINSTDPAKD